MDFSWFAQSFVALLAAHLSDAADIERLGTNQRVQALRLAGAWQSHLLDRARAQSDSLTAPQVAARYGVTPQAVYKWIKAGRVRAEQTPGGSWRLPADQFDDHRQLDRRRITDLRVRLAERARDAPPFTDEELADEIVARRRD